MEPRLFVQRMFTLLSVNTAHDLELARETYRRHREEGGAEEPEIEALLAAPHGTSTWVKLQRGVMAGLRQRMR
jgi:hypothetical protein